MSEVILVTGATRGIGRALAGELARRGHKVYGAGRSWSDEEESNFTRLKLDVTDDGSVKNAVAKVMEDSGRIDVLVNNAGISHCGSVEDTPEQIARAQFETNYFGVLKMIRETLPHMRGRERGTIAIVGSAAGKIGIPFQPHYAASKFAIEGLSEALRHELGPFGIRVLLIEPGDVRTAIWEGREHFMPEGSAYSDAIKRFLKVKAHEMGDAAAPPENAARQIADVIESNTKKLRHPAGKGAGFFLLARKLLPDSIFLWAVARNYKINT